MIAAAAALLVCDYCDQPEPTTRVNEEQGEQLCDACREELREVRQVPCSGMCGNTTTWDDTYGDLCSRCCRAENE